ncbi:MAG TPA: hypothetical protein VKH45_12835 [Candidatus Acidoferrum sp.]|nr:hypothetical protein [Candidatus Acidoferrum sp.]
MRNFRSLFVALSLTAAYACVSAAQEASIPKVLQITREFIKPGKSGSAHDKTESAFVDAMTRAKWPTHYIGMTSLSGKSRALYLTSYPSFDAWQKDTEATAKNATLSAALDRAAMADGELLESIDQGVFYLREEMSMHPRPDLSQMRYMEVSVFHVRPGKEAQWAQVVKMAKAAYEKGIPDAHWGMFSELYGGDSGSYLLLSSHKALAEIDKGLLDNKQFIAAMGDDLKKFDELYAECCEASQSQLFAFSPRQSYVQDEWIKADPSFWKPRAAAPGKPSTEDKKPN